MTSILTNAAAMSALQTLRSINNGMEDTQARVSSGLRVGNASDNAAYWSIATTMRSDNMALSAVQDALGLGAAKVDTAYAGMESVIEVVKEIKNKLVAATEDGIDKAKVQGEITQLTDQLKGIVESASFSGENWLKGVDGENKTVVGSFVREGGSVSVKTMTYAMKALVSDDGTSGILDREYTGLAADTVTLTINDGGVSSQKTVQSYTTDFLIKEGAKFDENIAITNGQAYVKVEGAWVKGTIVANADLITNTQELAGVFTKDFTAADDGMDAAIDDAIIVDTDPALDSVDAGTSILGIDITAGGVDLDALLKGVDAALTDLTSSAAELGSISMRIGLQEEFASKLSESIDKGVGRLVDADMNEESTRLKALQTQQQLAIQSLSIANSASQNILSLFR
ncbi:flagellin [Shinella sp. HZN7]|uniref:flagellin N-terminal helical domain-containing protein n=1 Tax=Shinella sp. (strain HZN7) TaxID=879274 RepID=UPI0007DA590C|nr:flagellin [Shinella sp. HZN7]ANH02862.1 flagellin [Shinella sp. HZN7]